MPTYEFKCRSCDHPFSVRTPWSKKKEVTCPQCNSEDLQEQWGKYRLSTIGGGSTSAAPAPSTGSCGSFG